MFRFSFLSLSFLVSFFRAGAQTARAAGEMFDAGLILFVWSRSSDTVFLLEKFGEGRGTDELLSEANCVYRSACMYDY